MVLAVLTDVITDDGEHFVHLFFKRLDIFFGEMSLSLLPICLLIFFSLLICMKKNIGK